MSGQGDDTPVNQFESDELEALANNTWDAIIAINTDDEILFWNPAAEELFGYSEDEVFGKSVHSLLAPEKYRDRIEKGFEQFLETGDGPAIEDTLELDANRRDGTTIPVELTVNSFERNGDQYIVAVVRDISERKHVREKLREREGHLTQAQKMADLGSWTFDLEEDTLVWSEGVYEIFKLDPSAEISFQQFLRYVHPEDRDYVRERWNAALDGAPYDIEHRIVTDGETKWVHERADVKVDDDGNPISGIGVVQDITAQKTREQDLLEERAVSKSIFRALPDILYALDTDGNYIRWNESLNSVTGYSDNEIENLDPIEIFAEEDRDRISRAISRVFETGETITVEGRIVGEDGNRIPYEFTGTVLKDDTGSVIGLTGIGRDVSERKAQAEKIKQARKQLRQAIDLVPDLIFAKNRKGEYLLANQAVADAYGLTIDEVEGSSDMEVLNKETEAKAFREDDLEVIDSGQPKHIPEEQLTTARGETLLLETWKIPFTEVGTGEDAILGYARNVTELREHKRQLQVIDRVLRHNLHNDMNVIEGYAETIKDTGSSPESEFADTIVETSSKVVETVDKQRQITQFLAEPPVTEAVDLAPIVEAEVSGAKRRHPDADISMDIPSSSIVNASRAVGRAIEELIENAIIHSDKARPKVTVNLTSGTDSVDLTVEDDGPGIPEMERRILTRDADIEPMYHGSGLGLWLVHLIVRHSNGELEFDMNEPRGSIVTLRFSPT